MQLPPEAEKFLRQEYKKYVAQGGDLSYPEFKMMVLQQAAGEQGPEQEEIMTTEAETIRSVPSTIRESNKVPLCCVNVYLSASGEDLLTLLLPFLINELLPPPPNNLLLRLFFFLFKNLAGCSSV